MNSENVYIQIDNNQIVDVTEYTYFGNTITFGKETRTKEFTRRMKLFWSALDKLS